MFGNIAFGKLCKKRIVELHQKEKDELTEIIEDDWQPLDFICVLDPNKQVLVMRYNSSVIPRITTIAKVLTNFANIQMFNHGYGVSFHPIVSKETFWQFIKSSKGVYRLTLNLESPNLFGANDSATKSLERLREIFNNSAASVSLKNPKGELKVPEERVKTYQEYADKGGGSWEIVVGKSSNRRRTIKSADRAIKITVEADESAVVRDLLKSALAQFEDYL
jgi:hypothetical protein